MTNKVNDELVYAFFHIVASKYYQQISETKKDYHTLQKFYKKENGNKLNINNEVDRKKLFCWAQEKCRYSLLNIMIRLEISRFLAPNRENEKNPFYDPFMIYHMDYLLDVMDMIFADFMADGTNVSEVSYSKLSKKDVDLYVSEILTEIDPSLEWFTLYQEAKKQGKIIYYHELSDKEQEEFKNANISDNCCYVKNNEVFILLNNQGTIDDVRGMIHEFIHYVINSKNRNVPRILKEYPSIFYELYALNFLLKKGYSDLEIETIQYDRLADTIGNMMELRDIFRYIETYLNQGQIIQEEDIKHHQESQESVLEIIDNHLKNVMKQNQDYFTPITMANRSCDKCIQKLMQMPKELHDRYPYIYGYYLATQMIHQLENDDTTLTRMKYITQNLSIMNPYDIFVQAENEMEENEKIKIKDRK